MNHDAIELRHGGDAHPPPTARAQKETPYQGQGAKSTTDNQHRSDSIPKNQVRIDEDPFGENDAAPEAPTSGANGPAYTKAQTGAEDAAGSILAGQVVIKPFAYRGTVPPRQIITIGGMKSYAKGFISVTGAAGGTGKSSLALVEELSLVYGIDLLLPKLNGEYLPLKCGRQRVWTMSLEDDEAEHQRRVIAVVKRYGLDPDGMDGYYFVTYKDDSPVKIVKEDREGAYVTPQVNQIKGFIAENKIDVLLVDPFVESHEVPENDNGAMNKVAGEWRGIAQTSGIALSLTHHLRKVGAGGEVTAEDLRGAVSLIGVARLVRVLQKMSAKEAEGFAIEPNRRSFYFWVNPSAKANITPPAERRSWFHMEGVDLENGTDEWESDVVGVVEAWTPPDPLGDVTGGDVSALIAKLKDADDDFILNNCRANSQATGWIGKLIGELIGEDSSTKTSKVINAWLKCGVLERISVKDSSRISRPCMRLGKAAFRQNDGDDFL